MKILSSTKESCVFEGFFNVLEIRSGTPNVIMQVNGYLKKKIPRYTTTLGVADHILNALKIFMCIGNPVMLIRLDQELR